MFDVIVIGGGAAGIFSAISAKQTNPSAKVTLLEKTAVLLAKVRVSGGGRCNVTHACFDPLALSKNYPRGEKELIGPFNKFQPKNTIEWFESKGTQLKTEPDGRIFPTTDNSETIIQTLLCEAKKLGVDILLKQKIHYIEQKDSHFIIHMKEESPFTTKHLILATGSNPDGHAWAKTLGHSIQPPVPSLFTFNVPNYTLKELSGISFEKVTAQIEGTAFIQTGPLLITHFGFSGPAILKLSAWGARTLHEKDYSFNVILNWLPHLSHHEITQQLIQLKSQNPQKTLLSENPFHFPKSFWKLHLELLGPSYLNRLNDISLKEISLLAEKLHSDAYAVQGKTTHKEEFVTCGGINLKEINFKTMESKICPGLFFAGEILDIDGITGGFNFQNAWTTGFIAGSSSVR